MEQRLFAALTTAGFDRDALIKMQTGECDTSSTLWHLLLENMAAPTKQNIPDALASAIHSRSQKQAPPQEPVDCGIQTSFEEYIKPYPAPVVHQQPIQTVGFGSPMIPQEKSKWFSSVKSWFGSSTHAKPPVVQRSRSSSNCSTVSSPIASPSSYRNFDTRVDKPSMSQAVYRSGSQKYRRRALQLSDPPTSELDQLTYNATDQQARQQVYSYQFTMVPSQVHMPPTALTASATDAFFTDRVPKEVDMRARYYRQQPTPPPSPPQLVAMESHVEEKSLSDFSTDEESEEEETIEPVTFEPVQYKQHEQVQYNPVRHEPVQEELLKEELLKEELQKEEEKTESIELPKAEEIIISPQPVRIPRLRSLLY
jgi:hypothetical protein